MALSNPALPKGSLVLVTGASGYVGSHLIDQFIQVGYKVRGTVRNVSQSQWLVELFEKKYGNGNLELAQVPEMSTDGAYDEAMKGVQVVAHAASPTNFSPDPNEVIPQAIAGAVNALKAAYKEASVKRFVMTSSAMSAFSSHPDIPAVTVTEETWNDLAIKMAWKEPPYEPEHGGVVYAASKASAEKEVWKYHKENREKRPDLTVNTVIPSLNFGKILDPVNQGYPSTAGMIIALWAGKLNVHYGNPPQYFTDVQDTARLHVAAALFEDIKEQRIFGQAQRWCWDDILDIMKEIDPEHTLPPHFMRGVDGNEVPPAARGKKLLQDLGYPGYTSLKESIQNTLVDYRAGIIGKGTPFLHM